MSQRGESRRCYRVNHGQYDVSICLDQRYWNVYRACIIRDGQTVACIHATSEAEATRQVKTWVFAQHDDEQKLHLIYRRTIKAYRRLYPSLKRIDKAIDDDSHSIIRHESEACFEVLFYLLTHESWDELNIELIIILSRLSGIDNLQSPFYLYQYHKNNELSRHCFMIKVKELLNPKLNFEQRQQWKRIYQREIKPTKSDLVDRLSTKIIGD